MTPEAPSVSRADRVRFHALSPAQALAELESSPGGLSAQEAARRLQVHGPNALPERESASILRLFLSQFQSPLIYLLLVAAAIALGLGERADAIIIVGVLLLNAVVGAVQEGRAERSMAALLQIDKRLARVLRDGSELQVEARELVPGDVVLLGAGDAVPADARLLEAASVEVSESALTGESVPVSKHIDAVELEAGLADRSSMLFSGTTLTAGRARAVVTATGVNSELGRVVQLAEQVDDADTALERRVNELGRTLLYVGLAAFVAVMAVGLWRKLPLAEILMIAISQLVSVIPEGLPVAMTVALAVGMQRMAKRGALVRRLSAVESLGSTTVICSDKTGTLTRNEMTVVSVWLADGRTLSVSGAGYEKSGQVTHGETTLSASSDAALNALSTAVALCNDAQLTFDAEGRAKPLGDPTEVALLSLALKAGHSLEALRELYPRTKELPFDSTIKLMATAHGEQVYLKGAPEAILALCQAQPEVVEAAREQASAMGEQALRVLAVAQLKGPLEPARGVAGLKGRVELLGLVGQFDPPRTEVAVAVATCQRAGVRTIMITGDHKATGVAIGKQLGIHREDDRAVDGRELSRMPDAELAAALPHIAVFARVEPADKLRIVQALQASGEVAAMTGDGVNDAPALARADVGVAMGITGTDAAKQAADIVVTDDNFSTIVSAVEEGRIVFQNIRKVVLLLLSTGMAEILVLLLSLLVGLPAPFAAVQILWNNVVTEGTVTVNLTMDPAQGDEMTRRPIHPGAPILDRTSLVRLVLMGLTITAVTLGFFAWRLDHSDNFAETRTATFCLLAVCEWFNVLNCRSETKSALNLDFLRNHWLVGGLVLSMALQFMVVYWRPIGVFFHTVPLPLFEFVEIGVLGSLVLWVEEIRKFFARRRADAGGPALTAHPA